MDLEKISETMEINSKDISFAENKGLIQRGFEYTCFQISRLVYHPLAIMFY